MAPPIEPTPPSADLELPWDAVDATDPVVALTDARRRLGDTFSVESGGVTYLFTFGEAGLRSFYAAEERDASKGLADYRMLVRKMPEELFAGRRTFAHDLFGAEEVQGYLDNLDWAIAAEIERLGREGSFDVFDLSRRLGRNVGRRARGARAGRARDQCVAHPSLPRTQFPRRHRPALGRRG